MSIEAIQAVSATGGAERLFGPSAPAASAAPQGASFAQVLMDGVGKVETKMATADAQVRAFAIDDSVPLHQVTFALEEARLSLELMVQVRSRLIEGFQQIMGMQL
jgi:flagellar hook-basal body complex protein FliE